MNARRLADLRSVGPSARRDLTLLGIESVEVLAQQDPGEMYVRLCVITGQRQDPCVFDVFHCAVAQAKNPNLPADDQRWWNWSWRRKTGKLRLPELPPELQQAPVAPKA